jgi:hypothetical protein
VKANNPKIRPKIKEFGEMKLLHPLDRRAFDVHVAKLYRNRQESAGSASWLQRDHNPHGTPSWTTSAENGDRWRETKRPPIRWR